MDDNAYLILTVREVARLLHVSPEFVRDELIRKGRLKAVRYTDRGQFRIHPKEVDAFLGHPDSQAENSSIARRADIRDAEARMKRHGIPLNEGVSI